VLAVPDQFGELYHLPGQVLGKIKELVASHLPVWIESPAQVALFLYDNNTFIVESFLDESVEVKVVVDGARGGIRDILSGEEFDGQARVDWRGRPSGKKGCAVTVKPHSFRVFELL
jgi:hypothetical protein